MTLREGGASLKGWGFVDFGSYGRVCEDVDGHGTRRFWPSVSAGDEVGQCEKEVQPIPACATGDIADTPGQSCICCWWEAMHHEPTSPEVRGPDAAIPVINIADPDSEALGR